MIKLVIFDLDGTLINSIADLATSTNYALAQNGFPTHETKAYKFFVGNGINKLFERALPEGEKTEENIQKIRASFLPYYEIHGSDESSVYPGIERLLLDLQNRDIKLAVASNKYDAGTKHLVKHFFPTIKFAQVYGQRDGVNPKPDPTIVFDILKDTNIEKDEAIYVGDSDVDMQTANNAGVASVGVTWGFRPRAELEKYSPTHIVDHAEQILALV